MDVLVEEATGRVRPKEKPRKADERAEGGKSFVPSGLSFDKDRRRPRWPSLLTVQAQVTDSQTRPRGRLAGGKERAGDGQTECLGVFVHERNGTASTPCYSPGVTHSQSPGGAGQAGRWPTRRHGAPEAGSSVQLSRSSPVGRWPSAGHSLHS